MSTYKVIQDIEAEDKLVGPLSLRQFLYAIAAVVGGYLCFLSVSKGAPFLLAVFVPVTAIPAFFAVPWRKEQTTEVWALAHLRYFLKPHVRIWNQSGVRQYVEIRAIKLDPKQTTNNMSPDEVQSRLKALASTIDTHGWAIKGATAADLSETDPLLSATTSDRLVPAAEMPRSSSHLKIHDDIQAHEDMLDDSNHVSKKLDTIIHKQTTERHDRLVKQVQEDVRKPPAPATPKPATGTVISSKTSPEGPVTNQWFVNAPGVPGTASGPTNITIISPGAPIISTAASQPTDSEKALAEQFKAQNNAQEPYYQNMRVVQPLGAEGTEVPPQDSATPAPTAPEPVLDAPVEPIHSVAPAAAATEAAPETTEEDRSVTAPIIKYQAPTEVSPPVAPGSQAQLHKSAPPVVLAPLPAERDPAIIGYANNNDLDVATIARQMSKRHSPNEVEIRLH